MELVKKELKKLSKNQLIEIILLQDKQIQLQQKQIGMQQEQIKTQQGQIQALEERIARLEKDSETSSKPPSSDPNKANRNQSLRKKSGKKPGGQPGHPGKTRYQENPDKVVHCQPVAQCSGCGAGLDITQSECVETRQEIDIPPIKAYVTEYQKMGITCQCGQRHVGQFPDHVTAHLQLAQRLKSFLVYLNVAHVLPYARLTQLMNDLFGIQICKRSIENALEETATKAMPVYHQIMTLIKQCKWVGSDETGCRVEGKRWWQWTWQSDLGSYYAIDQRRGYNVVKTHFGEDYQGTLCHDCWSAHNNTVAKSGHQQCHPHIQRELMFLIKIHKCKWAYDLNTFLAASQKARDRIFSEGFSPEIRTSVIEEYHQKLKLFLVKNGTNNDTLRLQKRLIKHQHSILLFMSDATIPFHNNSSERAIRMAKVKQKISGGFRSRRGAERHAILLSIIETAKKQRLNILSAIQDTLNLSLVFEGG